MQYRLVLGDKAYSSWSMRAWMLLRFVGAPFEEITIPIYRPGARQAVRAFGGQTGLVPVLIDRGLPIWDTLAIAERLYESFPSVWPQDADRRARARSYAGEVHGGLHALRAAMPVNTRGRRRRAQLTLEVHAEVARVAEIWTAAGDFSEGPWLFGEFCAADILFAPVASRFLTYEIALAGRAGAYAARLLDHPLAREWFALGAAEPGLIEMFEAPERA